MTALINLPRAAWKRQPSGLYTRNNLLFSWNAATAAVPKTSTVNGIRSALTNSTIIGYATREIAPPFTTLLVIDAPIAIVDIGVLFSLGPTNATGIRCDLSTGTYSINYIWTVHGVANLAQKLFIFSNPSANTHQRITWLANWSPTSVTDYFYRQNQPIFSVTQTFSNFVAATDPQVNIGAATAPINYYAVFIIPGNVDGGMIEELLVNPWQLFKPRIARLISIPSSGGATTYTDTLSIDALIQRAGLTQSTTIDALLQSAFSTSLSLDSLIAAVQSETLSLDALLQIVGTRTVSVDALLQAAKSGTVSVDALVQMTLAQNLSLDSMIQSGKLGTVSLDGLIQVLQTVGVSLDALLSQSISAAVVMDALIQASKSGSVSLDALITGASSTLVFVGLDALIQAIQSKTLSVDALLQKTYTNMLALDAFVALTQVKTISLDALLQSTKTGTLSLDAIIQMTRTAMISFDALIQAAKTGMVSLDAILVLATQTSVLLDAYVQKAVLRGVGLDAIIGAIADIVMPTGRVVEVPASDRWVFVTPSDRFIQA